MCNKQLDWCRHDKSKGYKTLRGVCPDCLEKGSKSQAGDYFSKIDPDTPLKTKEFMFSTGQVMYYYVDGDEIANKWTGEWTLAGNWMRYKFQPEWEIWIDITADWSEVIESVWHESLEAEKMMRGLDYNTAHLRTQKIEDFCRQNAAGDGGDETLIDELLSDNGIG